MGEFMKQSHTITNGLHCLMKGLVIISILGASQSVQLLSLLDTHIYSHGTYKKVVQKDLITVLCALLYGLQMYCVLV